MDNEITLQLSDAVKNDWVEYTEEQLSSIPLVYRGWGIEPFYISGSGLLIANVPSELATVVINLRAELSSGTAIYLLAKFDGLMSDAKETVAVDQVTNNGAEYFSFNSTLVNDSGVHRLRSFYVPFQ